MQIDRLSALISDCVTLRAEAAAFGDVVSFKALDVVALRLYSAKAALRRGDVRGARSYAWSACDLLSCIH